MFPSSEEFYLLNKEKCHLLRNIVGGGGVVGFSLSMQEFADGAKFNICRVPVASNLFVYLHSLRLCPSASKPLGK